MEDEREVRSLYRELLDAWNARDAGAMAALFAPDGGVVGFDGSSHEGPEGIRADLGRIFAHHPTASFVGKVRSVRPLSADVALLRAVAGMVPPGASALNPDVNAVQTLVAVRLEGGWRIASFQNTPAAFHGRPDLVERLTEELRDLLRGEPAA